MDKTLKALPFSKSALAPYISENTLNFHYDKHHQTYLDNLLKLITGSEWEGLSLEEIIKKSAGQAEKQGIYNNAAQVYNHDFYWQSLKPEAKIEPELEALIIRDFVSWEKFKEEFKTKALSQFGSGWIWLVLNQAGRLEIIKTANADNPLTQDLKPLLVLDVWEHAYYLDYQNRRSDYVSVWLDNLANWEFAYYNIK